MDQIAALASSGYKEVVISGIHLGAYGSDLNPATSLSELLGLIDGSRMMRRVRLSSIEPLEIEPGLIARIVESTSICRHLHVSLQSGDDTILRSMNRHYSSRYFSELIEVLVKNLPDVAVGLDVMTGFPGEGEREFKNTLSLIDGLPVAYLHVFPYSRRPGTIAAGYSDTVKEDAKKDRVRILRQLSNYKRNLFAKRFIGRKLSVLIETKPDRITGLKKGYTGNYIPVMIDSDDSNLSNRIIDVTCDNVRDGIILGRFKDHG
jgi:threonylcarbamoyladenosine tRNA methylthiotransferase MtaB